MHITWFCVYTLATLSPAHHLFLGCKQVLRAPFGAHETKVGVKSFKLRSLHVTCGVYICVDFAGGSCKEQVARCKASVGGCTESLGVERRQLVDG